MNRLEREGWAVVAAATIDVRPSEAAILRELVLSPGRFVGNEYLAGFLAGCEGRPPVRRTARRLSVRVARLRNALEVFGVPRAAIENMPDVGYAVAPHHARSIRQIVEGS